MTSSDPDLVWRALADRTRRELLDRLAEGPKTTGELVASCEELCRTAVMKHLDVLVAAGLVLVRREGRVRWNHLNPVPIQQVCDRWVSRHVRHLASAMSRLKQVAEESPPPGKQKGSAPCPDEKSPRSAAASSKSRSKPARRRSGKR